MVGACVGVLTIGLVIWLRFVEKRAWRQRLGSIALVTAVGSGNDYCNVAGWTGGTINVVCYNAKQNFADSRFNLAFQTAK